ncbi:MAG: hypothetical protein V2A74_12255 [bacterium]
MAIHKEKRAETRPPKSRLGLATFLAALAALVFALLAFWKVYFGDEFSKLPAETGSPKQSEVAGEAEKSGDSGAGRFDWNKLQERYEKLARLASDPDTYEQAKTGLEELMNETRDELSRMKDESEPKVRELLERLNTESTEALSAMRNRASRIEEKLHGLAVMVGELASRAKKVEEFTTQTLKRLKEVEPSDRIPEYR